MTRRPLLTLVFTLSLAASGCDGVAPVPAEAPSASAVEGGADLVPMLLDVPLLGAPAGDFLYDLAPLPAGATFHARLAFADGTAAELRSTGGTDGNALALSVEGLAPDSVTVSYLADRVPVAAPIVHRTTTAARQAAGGDPTFEAGTADSDPDSYHYEWHDGEIVLVKDYKEAASATARTGGGTAFTTLGGERVRVTEVAFTLHGVESGAPEAIRFATSSAFALQWFDLGQ